MVKKFFIKSSTLIPRRLFKFDLYTLYVPKCAISVVIHPEKGLYMCSLPGRDGDVFIECSSADKIMCIVRDCYRILSHYLDNDCYKSLTFCFNNV